MDRKNTYILAGAIVLGFLAFGLTQLSAQRFPGDGRGGEGMVGRYQVARSSPEAILLLDTVTGELYSASRDDIRPTSARIGGEQGFPGVGKRGFGKRQFDEFEKRKYEEKKSDFKDKAFDK
jgi:hypothetical protein